MEEMLDVFDREGNFLGTKTRSFCHGENPGVYHKPVWIWIINSKGEVMIQKRAKTKKTNPGGWDMPSAGHVAAGESCLACCVRETEEELGIIAEEKDFVFLKEFVNQRGWELAQVYLLKCDVDIKDIKLQVEEVECVKWLAFDEFVKMLYSDSFGDFLPGYKEWVVETLKTYIE